MSMNNKPGPRSARMHILILVCTVYNHDNVPFSANCLQRPESVRVKEYHSFSHHAQQPCVLNNHISYLPHIIQYFLCKRNINTLKSQLLHSARWQYLLNRLRSYKPQIYQFDMEPERTMVKTTNEQTVVRCAFRPEICKCKKGSNWLKRWVVGGSQGIYLKVSCVVIGQ